MTDTTAGAPVAATSRLDLRPVAGHLGAEVHGFDPHALDDETAEAIRMALAEHLVLFFPGIDTDAAGLRELGAAFGELQMHPYLDAVDGIPEVVELDTARTARADVWHTDATFMTSPPVASILHMIECPDHGGDTMWIDARATHDALSVAMQGFLAGLTCIHDDGGQGDRRAEHPVVRVHPVTGRRILYVHRQFARRIPQLSRPESQALLAFLFRWQEQVKFSVRWRWTPGDVVMWDNRATLHVLVDDTPHRRLLHRVTVLGDDPRPPEGTTTPPRYHADKGASSGYFGIGGYEF